MGKRNVKRFKRPSYPTKKNRRPIPPSLEVEGHMDFFSFFSFVKCDKHYQHVWYQFVMQTWRMVV